MTPARKPPARKRTTPTPVAAGAAPASSTAPAAQREAEDVAMTTIEWGGLTFEVVGSMDEWDVWTVIEPFSAGNYVAAVFGLLGPAQMARLRQAHPRLTNREFRDLCDAISRAVGVPALGN